MLKLLRNNEELKSYIGTIYNKFRNKNYNFGYEMLVDWFNADMSDIANESVKESMARITDEVENLMLEYSGTTEQDEKLDKIDEKTLNEICKLPDDYFPIVAIINAFGSTSHDYVSFEFENAKGLTVKKDNADVIDFLKENL